MPLHDPELLEPAFLVRLERLVQLARRAPPPRPKRRRRFLLRGRGVEVASWREYAPGDDVRALDWAVYARLDRLFVRLLEDVVEPRLEILIDVSGSMGRGTPEPLKRATRAAASVAAVALARGARVSIWAVGPQVTRSAPVRGAGRLVSLLRFLASLEPRGETALEKGALRVARSSRQRGGALLLSDLVHPDDAASALARLRREGFDTLAVEVSPQAELDPAAAEAALRAGTALLVDAETGAQKRVAFGLESLVAASRERGARGKKAAQQLDRKGIARTQLGWDRPVEEIALSLLERDERALAR